MDDLQRMKLELDVLRRFLRATRHAFDSHTGNGPGLGTDLHLQMMVEISDEHERLFGPMGEAQR